MNADKDQQPNTNEHEYLNDIRHIHVKKINSFIHYTKLVSDDSIQKLFEDFDVDQEKSEIKKVEKIKNDKDK